MTDSISFALIVNIPTILFVVLAFVEGIPGEYGRRAMVVYAALLIAVFGTLFGVALASPAVIYIAIIAGFAAAALSGPWGLLIAGVTLGVISTASSMWASPFSLWAPAIAVVGSAAVFVQSRLSGRF